MIRHRTILFSLVALLTLLAAPTAAQEVTTEPSVSVAAGATPAATPRPLPTAMPYTDGSLVQVVLYFSPTCPHCHTVITETLPPLFAANGGTPVVTYDQSVAPEDVAWYLMSNGQLQVLLVNVATPTGQAAFGADNARLGIEQAGVPRLDVEDRYLVGSGDIPAELPGIVASGLAGSGVDWPPAPGLDEALAYFVESGAVPAPAGRAAPSLEPSAAPSIAPADTLPAESAVAPTSEASATPDAAFAAIPVGGDSGGGPLDKFGQDPLGNGIATLVLLLLGLSVIAAPLMAARGSLPTFPAWTTIVLAVAGMAVAGYLANVETSGSQAVCGPVGDCNAVQTSSYARLFGIHIGVLGLVGYGSIALLWVVSRVARGALVEWALMLIALGALFGVTFSAYLTFLEPFVIGATCMWCITSALLMLALLWVSVGPGWAAWQRLHTGSGGGAEPAAA